MGLGGRVFDQTVDFAKCMKNTRKMFVFSKFERSWPVKLEPLGQPEGGQDGKNGLAQGHLRGQDSKSGPGLVKLTANDRKSNENQVTSEVKVYLSGQPYD